MDRFCFELCVVRGRPRPDVARRAGKSLPKDFALALVVALALAPALAVALALAAAIAIALTAAFTVHSPDGEGLPFVPVRIDQRRDRAGVVEEGVSVGECRFEAEFERDVSQAVAVVVDVDLVEHVIAKLIEGRATWGDLGRDVICDES